MDVVEITAADTHPLRRDVLRNADPDCSVVFAQDHWPGVFHLGLRQGDLVAISTWVPRPCAQAPARRAIQLRGMATSASRQGCGLGRVLFDAGIERCASAGFEVVWARARDAALGFYRRQGCTVVEPGFIDPTTGLPHHVVIRRLHPAGHGELFRFH